jgi:membrane associated rhomboid family serine protease
LLLFFPYKVDVQSSRKPFANYLVMMAMVAAFALQLTCPQEKVDRFVLDGWSLQGLLGYMWLHVGYGHIIGNLIFIWVFGNAVCAKVGNLLYLPIYIAAGLLGGIVHLMFDSRMAIGASGAIFGIIGTYLVLYPYNSIRCFFWFLAYVRRFSIAGFWIIILWVALNILGAVSGYTGGAAYFAHIGGFVAGLILAIILLQSKLVARDSMDDAIFRSIKA